VKPPSPSRLMTVACVLALAALALIVWSLFDPRPVPVIAAMSVGQGLGTLSFGAFLLVVLRDVRARYRRVDPTSTDAKQETRHER
jgi:hypothetical protein